MIGLVFAVSTGMQLSSLRKHYLEPDEINTEDLHRRARNSLNGPEYRSRPRSEHVFVDYLIFGLPPEAFLGSASGGDSYVRAVMCS